ncbi:MAG: RluA family pseudouridine synthase [Pirellulaceae bacterium]
MITRTACVTPEQSGRVDAIVKSLTNLSHSKLRGLFDHGGVSVNGQTCTQVSLRVGPGDQVNVRYDPQQGFPKASRKWVDRSFSVVFEDPHILVVNKSAQLLTVATDRNERNTLVSRVSHYLQQTSRHRQALVAHRLDLGVSGLLVLAKSPTVLAKLRDQFRQRKPERQYIAIVAGLLEPSAGTFRSFLQTAENLDRYSTHQEGEGQLAITHYHVQRKLRDTTVVEVRLETGRRNQIRVHFAEAGHPVLGDPRYGGLAATHERWSHKRMALHALSLGLEHPVTGKPMQFQSELPACMEQFISTANK